MSETKKKKSYFVGPFKKAMDNVDAFSINMYYAYYYQNAIQNIIDMDEEEEEQHEETYDELLKMITDIQYRQIND
jgi:hypothetical protein